MEAKEVSCGSSAICWRFVFKLRNKEYALNVDNNNTVTAVEVPDEDGSKKGTHFVPTNSVKFQEFVWEMKSDDTSQLSGKYIAVDEEGRLSVIPPRHFVQKSVCSEEKETQ